MLSWPWVGSVGPIVRCGGIAVLCLSGDGGDFDLVEDIAVVDEELEIM